MDTIITLGDFAFDHTEVPESINFGGEQHIVSKMLIGGLKISDSLGKIDDDISWSGLFFGTTAWFRARFLDGLRVSGQQITFTYFGFVYDVIIKKFTGNFERFYQIPYSITLEVINDKTIPITVPIPTGFDDAIGADVFSLVSYAGFVDNPLLTSSVLSLLQSFNNTKPFQSASSQQVNSFLAQVVSTTGIVNGLIGSLG